MTASTIIAERRSWVRGPSACWLRWWRCGIRWSSPKRKSIPAQKPMTAGRLLHSGDQQAPDGRGHHDTGGEVSEPLLHLLPQSPPLGRIHRQLQERCPKKGRATPKIPSPPSLYPSCPLSVGTSFVPANSGSMQSVTLWKLAYANQRGLSRAPNNLCHLIPFQRRLPSMTLILYTKIAVCKANDYLLRGETWGFPS